MTRFFYIVGLLSCVGCVVSHPSENAAQLSTAAVPANATSFTEGDAGGAQLAVTSAGEGESAGPAEVQDRSVRADSVTANPPMIERVDHERVPAERPVVSLADELVSETAFESEAEFDPETTFAPGSGPSGGASRFASPAHERVLEMNLPTALAMIGGQHPAVGFAQWRVQQAYAELTRARVLWLPTIQGGFSFHRHDGNYQASGGEIVDVNRNSFQYGLGVGATGAGTTPRPGLVARFHMADAIFLPEIAEKRAWAQGHAANAVLNEQLLTVATAYLELLEAHQDRRILQEMRDRTSELSGLTADFAETGQGLRADADRLETELRMVEDRLVSSRERVEVASARLAQALSVGAAHEIVPVDPTVVPIDLVSSQADEAALISTGLSNRPELKESQALVAAACDEYRRQKYAPFVPSTLLGFSTGGFGGGLGNSIDNVDSRYDFDAVVSWEVRNLGWGEHAARRDAASRVQQAKYEKICVMDQVAREVSEAHARVRLRAERITLAQQAIESAENSYQRNLSRIRDGQGLPLEVLQSVQALEEARRTYLEAVANYNEAQFQLQWALGWTVAAPEQSPQSPSHLPGPGRQPNHEGVPAPPQVIPPPVTPVSYPNGD